MATYYWRSAVNAAWTSNNWSLTDGGGLSGTYPQAADTAIFKASSGQGACYLDAARTITKMDMRSDYTGTFSAATYAFATTGDCIIAGTTVWMGSASQTWTVAGNFDYQNCGNLVPGSCTLKMTGTSKFIYNSANTRYFYNLDISGTITTATNPLFWHNRLDVRVNKSLTLAHEMQNYNLGATRIAKMYLESGALVAITTRILSWFTPGTGGIASMASTARITNTSGYMRTLYGSVATGGGGTWDFGATYGWETNFRVFAPVGADGIFTFPNKVCKISGWFQTQLRSWYPSGSLTLYAAGNSTDVQFGGYFSTYSDTVNTGFIKVDNTGASGNYWRFNSHVYDWMQTGNGASRDWTKVAELVYASGSNSRTWDFTSWSVKTIQVYAAGGTVTLDSDITADGFDVGSTSTFDANDYDLYINNNFFVRSGTTWTLSTSTVITLQGTSASNVEAVPRVDPIVLNRTAGGMTQAGHVHTSGLTLTDGTWDAATYDLETHTGFYKGPDACDLGTGDITVWGGINISGMTASSCQVIFAATQTLTYTASQVLNKLKVNSGITCNLMAGVDIILLISSTIDLQSSSQFDTKTNAVRVTGAGTVLIRTGAVYTGTGSSSLLFFNSTSGSGITLNDGFFNSFQLRFWQSAAGTRLAPGIYNTDIIFYGAGSACNIKPDSGTFDINGNVLLYNSGGNTCNVDMTNNPTWKIEGDCTYGGGLTSADVVWTGGFGETLEFDGSANQYYYWGHEVGNVIIDNAGTGTNLFFNMQSGSHLHCQDLTGTDGGLASNTFPVTVEGNCILDLDSVSINTGSAWNLWGNFDWKDCAIWSVHSAATFTMNGVSKYLLGINTNTLPTLIVPAGKSAYIHASTSVAVEISVSANIYGTLSVASGLDIYISAGANLRVETTGRVDGVGDVFFIGVTAGTGLVLVGSYVYTPGRTFFYNPTTTSLIPAGTYGGSVRVESTLGTTTWRPGTGTYTIGGYLLFNAANGTTLNVDNRYAQPVFTVAGILYLRANPTGTLNVYNNHATLAINWNINSTSTHHYNTFNWFKGTGTITYQGGNDRFIDFWDNSVEDIVVNKTAATLLSLNYHTDCESLTISSGDFDAATYDMTVGDVNVTTTGSVDYGSGSTWYVSGDFITYSGVGVQTGLDADFEFSGSGKICWPRNAQYHGSVWFKTGSSYQLNNVYFYSGVGSGGQALTIDGAITGTGRLFHFYGPVYLNASGNFTTTGSSFITSYRAQSGGGIAAWAGTYNPGTSRLSLRDWYSTGILTPADYSTNNIEFRIYTASNNGVVKFSAGTYTFYNWTTFADGAGAQITNIDTTNDPSIIVKGPITFSETTGTTTYTKGSGTVTMDSTGDFVITTLGLAMENMVIDKDSGITLGSDLDVTSLEISNGDFDAAGYNVTVSADALDISTFGTVDCGSGTWTCWGDVIIDGTGTYNEDTADFYLKGASKNLAVNNGFWSFRNIYVTGSYSANGDGAADNVIVTNICDITGTLAVGPVDDGDLLLGVNSDLRIQSGGTLTDRVAGTGYIRFYAPEVGITVLDGTLNQQVMLVYYPHTNSSWVPGTYDCRTDFVSSTTVATVVNFDAGTYDFTGGLIQFRIGITAELHTFDMTVNLDAATVFQTSSDTPLGFVALVSTSTGDIHFNTNNADLNLSGGIFQSDFSAGTVFNWNKGTGTITFEGTGTVGANVTGWSLEDIVINNVGGVLDFVSAVTCETYTVTGGNADFNDDATTDAVSITGGAQSMTGTNKTWTCPSFTVNAGTSATVDVNDNNVTVTGTGDLSFLANCTITMGQRTWTCNGNFSATGASAVLVRETSTLKLTGTSKTFTATGTGSTKYLYNVEIAAGASITVVGGSVMRPYGTPNGATITIDGTLTCTGPVVVYLGCDTILNSTGVINGASYYQHYNNGNGYGFKTFHASSTFSPATYYFDYPVAGTVSAAGVYDCIVYVRCFNTSARKWETSAGTYTFNSTVNIQSTVASGSLTIDNSLNDCDMVFKGSVVMNETGDVIWTAGTGTVTFDGTGNHTADFGGELIEDAHIEKDSSGKITLTDNFSAGSLTITTGKFDADTYDVTLTGNFLMTAGTGTEVWCGSGTWDIGGNFNNVAVTTNLFHAETSEIQLTGSGTIQAFCDGYNNDFHRLTVSGTYTMPSGSSIITIYEGSDGWLKIVDGGTFTLADTVDSVYISANHNLIIEAGGELIINANCILYMFDINSGYGITTNAGEISGAGTLWLLNFPSTAVWDDGIYCATLVYSTATNTATMGSGTYTFNGDLGVQAAGAGDVTIDMGTNSPTVTVTGTVYMNATSTGTAAITRAGATTNWNIGGDFDLQGTGTHSYTKGAGGAIITLNGTSDQNVDFSAGNIEDLVNNKASGQTILDAAMTAETLTGTNGDFTSNGYTVNVGDVDWNADLINMSTGTWTCSGNFDVDDADVNVAATLATLVMTGSSKTLAWRYLENLENLDIDTGASVTWKVSADGNYGTVDNINLDGILNITAGDQIVLYEVMDINATGVMGNDGNGNIWLRGTTAAHGIQTYAGSLNIATLYVHPQAAAATDQLGIAGTYTCSVTLQFYNSQSSDRSTVLGAGSYVFATPDVYIRTTSTGKMTVDNTANANITFNGGLQDLASSTGTRVWLKGTGLATFAGAGTHTVEWNMGDVEDIDVDCVGSYTLADHLVPDSFTMTAGSWDADAYDTTISGDFDLVGGALSAGDGTWTITGNADFNSGGTLTRDTSKFVFNGSSVTVTGGYTSAYMHKVEFATAFDGILAGLMLCIASTGSADDVVINGTVDVTGTLTNYYNTDVTFGASANFSGVGFFRMKWSTSTVTMPGGTVFAPAGVKIDNCYNSLVFPARDYAASGVDLTSSGGHKANEGLQLQTGNTTFDNVTIYNASGNDIFVTVPSSANFHVTGNLEVREDSTGKILWGSTGDLYLSGSANANADTNDIPIGSDVFVQKPAANYVTLDSNLSCADLTLNTGRLDVNDVNLTATGDFEMKVSTRCWAGAGSTWDVGGDFSTLALGANDYFQAETSEIKLTGTGNLEAYCNGYINDFHKLTVSGNYTTPSASASITIYEGTDGWLKIENGGKLTVADTGHFIWVRGSNDLIIETGGELAINSNARVYVRQPPATYGIPTNDGSVTGAGELRLQNWISTSVIDPGTYCSLYCYQSGSFNAEVEFESGTYTINGNLQPVVFGTGNMVVDIGINNSVVNVSGDIIIDSGSTGTATLTRASATNDWKIGGNWTLVNAGPKVYTKGSAGSSITLNGTGAQAMDFSAGNLEDLINNKASGTATLTANMTAETLTGTNGDFSAATFDVDVGDVDWNMDTLTMGSGTWTCSSNFNVDDADVTVSGSSATLVMTGSSKVLGWRFNSTLGTLDIDTGASVTWIVSVGGNYGYATNVNVDGTLLLTAGDQLISGQKTDISASGVLGDGNGNYWQRGTLVTHGMRTMAGTFDVNVFYINPSAAAATDLLPVAGTYTATTRIIFYAASATDVTTALGAGPYVFDTPEVRINTNSTGKMTVDNTANANLTFNGGIDDLAASTGVREWLKGTGLVTFAGASTHTIEWNMGEIEDIDVNCAGTYTLVDDLDTESFLLTTGTWDSDSYDMTISGDFDFPGGTLNAGSGNWAISGNADFASGGTFVKDSSKMIFDGTSVTVTAGSDYVHKIEFATAFDGILAGSMYCNPNTGSADDIVFNGTVDIATNFLAYYNSDITVGASANVSGAGILTLRYWYGAMTVAGGGVFGPSKVIAANTRTGMILPAYDFATNGVDLEVSVGHTASDAFELSSAGDIKFDNVEIKNLATNDVNITLISTANLHATGDLDVYKSSTGELTWSTNGTMFMSGTGDETANTNDIPLCGFTVDKNSGVTLDSDLNVDSLTISDGDFDANNFDVTVSPNDTDWSTNGVISMGTGSTWALSGSFDYSSFSGTLTEETSLVVMDGTSKTIEGNNVSANTFYDVNIDGTITTAGTGYVYQDGDLNINGTLTLTGQGWRMRDTALAIWTGGVYVNGGGTVTGAGELRMDRASGGGGLLSTTGDLTLGLLTFGYPESTGVLPVYDYSPVTEVKITQATGGGGLFNWQDGAYTFNDLTLESTDSANLTVDGRTNTPTSITIEGDLTLEAASSGDVLIYNNHATQALDWVIQGDVTLTEPSTGEVIWTKGTGGIDFTGTANQSVDLDVNGTLEEFTMNKVGGGTLTFTGNWISESFLAVDGELDFNGQTVQTTGDFTINAANGTDATIVSDADAMNTANITVGNDFYVSNVTFNATATWYLDVQGANADAYDVSVRYSNANAGTTIDATTAGNTDLGVNYNWDFGQLPGEAVSTIHALSFHNFAWTRHTNRYVRGNRRH